MCEPGRSRGPSLLAAAGVVTGVLAGAAVLRFAESIAEAVALTVFGLCAVCIAGLARLHWAFLVRVFARPRRVLTGARLTANQRLIAARLAHAALPAPRRALDAPVRVLEGVIIEKEAVK